MGTALFGSLTPPQRASLSLLVDQARPVLVLSNKLLNQFRVIRAAAVASPSGQPSTVQDPAPDSLLGLALSLSPGEPIPLANTSLAGARPLLAGQFTQTVADMDATISAHATDSAFELYVTAGGVVNVLGS